MTTQQLADETACVSAPPCCPNCGKTTPIEVLENLADLAVHKKQRLLKRVLDAHEQERQSLANRLQEGLAQQMIGALLRLQAVGRMQQGPHERAAIELRAVGDLLNSSIDEARRIASRLRPSALDEFGIVAGINFLTAELARNAELEIEFSHDCKSLRMPTQVETALFRIVQQLLTNVSRHSQTRKVRVKLARTDDHVQVEIRDWGIGFDPARVKDDSSGLQEIRERAELLGGRTTIDSAPGEGTRVVVELPLEDGTPA